MSEDTHYGAQLLDVLERITRDWAVPLAPLRAVRPGIGGRPGTANAPLPVPVALTDARAEVATSLFGWCAVLVEERRLEHARVDQADVPGMCELMGRHDTWWATHEARADMLAELDDRATRLHRLVAPSRSVLVRIGTCTLTRDGMPQAGPCGGLVIADPQGGRAYCRTCRASGTIEEWRAVLPVPAYVTVRELARIAAYEGLAISEGGLRGLIDRGLIEAAERDQRGRRLLRRDDAIAALRTHLAQRGA